MKTVLLYLEDSYLQTVDASILESQPEGDKRFRVMLDKTVFYPMGGGQPTDQGELASDNWQAKVYMVMMKDGEIWHYIESPTVLPVGTQIHGQIDWNRRFKNMRMHSAGHVVDFSMFLLGYSPNTLKPLKGDHGKKPYIVYKGTAEKDIKQELENKSNELVAQNLAFSCEFVPLEQLTKDAIYLQPGLPTNKPLRKLTLETVGSVADGGTQVKNTKEVGRINILSVTVQDGNTIVVYGVV